MIFLQRIAFFIGLFLLSTCTNQPFSSAEQSEKIAQILEISGINSQFDNIPLQITAGLQQPSVLPAEFNQILANALFKSFDPEAMKTSIQNYMELHLSIADTNAVLNWLNSPLGLKIAALESTSSTPEARMEMQEMLPVLLSDARRFSMIRKLDQATNTSASTIILILGVQEALMRGMMIGAPKSQQMSDEEIQKQVNSMAPEIRSQYEFLVVASMAYTYRSLTDEEVSAYIDFSRSPTGIQFNQTMMAAISQAMSKAGQAAGQEVSKNLPAKKTGV